MSQQLNIAKNAEKENVVLLSNMANRHGLITGATGTGKTVTLQKMAEAFSQIGVPVFISDIKGDISCIAKAATPSERLDKILDKIGVTDWEPNSNPTVLWDVFGERGHPLRATIADMGPLFLGRLLNLNEVQSGLLQVLFKIADDNNLLLLDMKDLRTMTQYVIDNANEFKSEYGNINSVSGGSILRNILALSEQGATNFFGEPMLDIQDFIRTDNGGKGVINILMAEKLYHLPKLYAMTLLWMLSTLYEQMPEQGDLDKPKLVFFFDEAHLLFSDSPPVLLEKIERVVRLIRSKGIGVYFVTQNPMDVPDKVLGQLGNRVQHALRAFSPRDQKAVKAAAQTMRANPAFSTEQAITELGTGEALISFLDEKGSPSIVQKCFVIAPESHLGPLSPDEQTNLIQNSIHYGKYEEEIDSDSAHEILKRRIEQKANEIAVAQSTQQKAGTPNNAQQRQNTPQKKNTSNGLKDIMFGTTYSTGRRSDGLVQTGLKSATKMITPNLIKSVLNSLLNKKK